MEKAYRLQGNLWGSAMLPTRARFRLARLTRTADETFNVFNLL